MRKYKNICIEDADKMGHSEIIETLQIVLEGSTTSEKATIVADLMARYDEDIYETEEGQFFCYSNNPDNLVIE